VPGTRLRLGLLRSLPFARLVGLIAAFAKAEPSVSLELTEGNAAQLATLLERGRLDATITLFEQRSDRQTSAVLFREPYCIAAAVDHPLARRVRCRLAEFDGMAFVLRSDCEVQREAQRIFVANGIRPRILHRGASDERAIALARAGLALTLVPESLLCDGLAPITVDELDFGRRIALCWRAGAPEPVEQLHQFAVSQQWSGAATAGRLAIAH